MTYDIGDQARVTATFRNLQGVAYDPTAVLLTVVTPSRVSVTYTYAAAQITKDSTGVYHRDIDLTEHGVWAYRWAATGSLVASEEGTLFVRRRRT